MIKNKLKKKETHTNRTSFLNINLSNRKINQTNKSKALGVYIRAKYFEVNYKIAKYFKVNYKNIKFKINYKLQFK